MTRDAFGIVGTVQADSFRVDAVVAEGGFAVVYRAHHEGFRADVALKCLKVPGTLNEDERAEFLERFRGEAELLFRLSSALGSVVRPLHVGTLNSAGESFVPFIALEWLSGQTLADLVDERHARGLPPLTLAETLDLLAPVAATLERAHHFPATDGEISILHRDLKPENIFVAQAHGQRQVKILDFGIAKVKRAATQIAGRRSAVQTALGAFTPAYAAPEQWLPKRFGQTGTWTDVWGLALTAVELMIARPPLEGDAASVMGAALDLSRRPTPSNEGAAVNASVEAVFQRALAVDPMERYREIADFWSELRSAAGARGTAVDLARRDNLESLPPEAIAAAQKALSLPPPRRYASQAELDLEASSPQWTASALPSPREQLARKLSGAPQSRTRGTVKSASGSSRSGPFEAPLESSHGTSAEPNCSVEGVGGGHLNDGQRHAEPPSAHGPQAPSLAAPPPPARRRRAHKALSEADTAGRGRLHPGLRDLEGVGIMPTPELRVSEPPQRTPPSGGRSWRPSFAGMPLRSRVAGPLKLLALAVIIMVADWLFTHQTGTILALGPVRPLWVAGPMAIIALGLVIYAVITTD